MATKLQVKDLRISFRTVSGKVQAVRGIDFDLEEGETLAIVGESGSGKSVTSKAILGILAGNSIVEGGEIIYDGKDLLKIPEEEFHKIRGDKIAMIFQDPLSSLNPIVKIGKQLTEAMLLKGKARQKASRSTFNGYLALLKRMMIETLAKDDAERAAHLALMCKNFDKFEFKHTELESEYNEAHNSAVEAITEIDNLLFLIEKNALKKSTQTIKEILDLARKSISTYVVSGDDANAITASCDRIKQTLSTWGKGDDVSVCLEEMPKIKAILESAIALEAPNFFSLGYYLTFATEPLPELPMPELNAFLRKYLDDSFMLEFIANAKVALMHSAQVHDEAKAVAVNELGKMLVLLDGTEDYSTISSELNSLIETVKKSIDPLEIEKDSVAYTFATSIRAAVDICTKAKVKNAKEQKRFEREQAKHDAYSARKGHAPDWKVTPAAVIDMDVARGNVKTIVTRLLEHYEQLLSVKDERNFDDITVQVIDFLKLNASGVVNRVTRRMAKHRAIKLMEEVGIAEPRKRYNQYPFEFSGGMRQRIVIAIALAANPDILICDEPTTALDVTIQAQILELINKLKKERNLSVIFITHDLGVVANMADKIAVMYAGKIVEKGTAEDIFYDPRHPYTWALLSSMPDLDTSEKLEAIPGTPPNMIYPPKGDAFAQRNKYALKIDFEMEPPMFRISDTHYAATWLLHPDAPKVEIPKIISERIARMREKEGGNPNE